MKEKNIENILKDCSSKESRINCILKLFEEKKIDVSKKYPDEFADCLATAGKRVDIENKYLDEAVEYLENSGKTNLAIEVASYYSRWKTAEIMYRKGEIWDATELVADGAQNESMRYKEAAERAEELGLEIGLIQHLWKTHSKLSNDYFESLSAAKKSEDWKYVFDKYYEPDYYNWQERIRSFDDFSYPVSALEVAEKAGYKEKAKRIRRKLRRDEKARNERKKISSCKSDSSMSKESWAQWREANRAECDYQTYGGYRRGLVS